MRMESETYILVYYRCSKTALGCIRSRGDKHIPDENKVYLGDRWMYCCLNTSRDSINESVMVLIWIEKIVELPRLRVGQSMGGKYTCFDDMSTQHKPKQKQKKKKKKMMKKKKIIGVKIKTINNPSFSCLQRWTWLLLLLLRSHIHASRDGSSRTSP